MRAESFLPAPTGTYDKARHRWIGVDGTDVTPRRADVLAQIGEADDAVDSADRAEVAS